MKSRLAYFQNVQEKAQAVVEYYTRPDISTYQLGRMIAILKDALDETECSDMAEKKHEPMEGDKL